MPGRYKILEILIFVLGIVKCTASQTTIESIATNFCFEISFEDNLSCSNAAVGTGSCFSRDLLCNGVRDCINGEDEGDDSSLSSLQCKYFTSSGQGFIWLELNIIEYCCQKSMQKCG